MATATLKSKTSDESVFDLTLPDGKKKKLTFTTADLIAARCNETDFVENVILEYCDITGIDSEGLVVYFD